MEVPRNRIDPLRGIEPVKALEIGRTTLLRNYSAGQTGDQTYPNRTMALGESLVVLTRRARVQNTKAPSAYRREFVMTG